MYGLSPGTKLTVRNNEVSAKRRFEHTTVENQTYDMTPAVGVSF